MQDYDIQFSASLPSMQEYFGMPKVKVTRPFGAGDAYFVFVDNGYQGQILLQNDRLVAYLNPTSKLTEEDIASIIQRIERGEID